MKYSAPTLVVTAVLVVGVIFFIDVQPTLGLRVALSRLAPISQLEKAKWIEGMCQRTFVSAPQSFTAVQRCMEVHATADQREMLEAKERFDSAKGNLCQNALDWIALAERENFDQTELTEQAGVMVVRNEDQDSYLIFKTEGEKTFSIFYYPSSKQLSIGETLATTITVDCSD